MENKPYIGITGFTTRREVSRAEMLFNQFRITKESSHIPMFGFLVSYKYLNKNDPYPHDNRYPSISKLFDLLLRTQYWYAFRTIHYNTHNNEKFFDELDVLLSYVDVYGNELEGLIEGIQLNIKKPSPKEIEKIRDHYPGISIILQLNERYGNGVSIEKLTEKIFNDFPSISNCEYILIDTSRGKGKPIDINFAIKKYCAIKRINPKIQVGFAGGFSGDNVFIRTIELYDSLLSQDFCIDAEGQLRDHSKIDLFKLEAYIQNFSKAIQTITSKKNRLTEDILTKECRKCHIAMKLKGDMRYEDLYYECPVCGLRERTIIRG